MKLAPKLAEWQREGLLDGATAARIEAYEGRAKAPYLLYAVGGLGALAVSIGLLSIVAANWEAIPAGLKLALDFVLLGALAAAIYRVEAKSWIREVVIFVFYGAVLASIGLVAQVYHQGGKLGDALLLWGLITAPVVLHGNGRVLGATWLIALQTMCLLQLEEHRPRFFHESAVTFLASFYVMSLGLIALGAWGHLRRVKPELAGVAATLGRLELVALATLAPLAWYEEKTSSLGGFGVICVVVVLLAAAIALAVRDEASRGSARGAHLAFVGTAVLTGFLPWVVAHDKNGLMAVLSFFVSWSLLGFIAYRQGRFNLLNVATAFLGVRLLIIYFEVFGSLLDTGIGLLSGGVLTLLLAWIWVRWARRSSGPKNGESLHGRSTQ